MSTYTVREGFEVEGCLEDATDAAQAALGKMLKLSKELISIMGDDESSLSIAEREQKALRLGREIDQLQEQAFVMVRDGDGVVTSFRYRTARAAH
jgi:hypothetical protein